MDTDLFVVIGMFQLVSFLAEQVLKKINYISVITANLFIEHNHRKASMHHARTPRNHDDHYKANTKVLAI